MHEASIAESIIKTTNKIIKHNLKHNQIKGCEGKEGLTKGLTVNLGIGELAGVTFEDLDPFLKHLKPDWRFKHRLIPAIAVCDCGFKGKPKILLKAHDLTIFECPECGKIPKLKQGGEVLVLGVKY